MTKVVYIVTAPVSAEVLLRGQLAFMRKRGFEVTVIASPGEELNMVASREGVMVLPVPMEREIRPFADLISLFRLTAALMSIRPEIVNASTPKAGLLGMIAARITGVPIRIYLLRGLRLETTNKLKRRILMLAERISAAFASEIICISESLRSVYLDFSLTKEWKIRVLGAGSSNGIDVTRFEPTEARTAAAARLRNALAIPARASVVGFVGRLTRDKGVTDLVTAFEILASERSDVHLLVVGYFESGDAVDECVANRLRAHPRAHLTGRVTDLAPYYHLMDILAFPSHREGFGNVVIEASAASRPIVAYNVTGVKDAVADGETGTLVSPRNVNEFSVAIAAYLDDPALRERHGKAGLDRVRRKYSQEDVWTHWEQIYRIWLNSLSTRVNSTAMRTKTD